MRHMGDAVCRGSQRECAHPIPLPLLARRELGCFCCLFFFFSPSSA